MARLVSGVLWRLPGSAAIQSAKRSSFFPCDEAMLLPQLYRRRRSLQLPQSRPRPPPLPQPRRAPAPPAWHRLPPPRRAPAASPRRGGRALGVGGERGAAGALPWARPGRSAGDPAPSTAGGWGGSGVTARPRRVRTARPQRPDPGRGPAPEPLRERGAAAGRVSVPRRALGAPAGSWRPRASAEAA